MSRQQVKQIDETLVSRLESISGDDAPDRLSAAIALFLMNITPVVPVEVGFGGDNHADAGLEREREGTIAGVANLNLLFAALASAGLADKVTVANLSVFGRTLAKKGTSGRDHNLNHHVMMISGSNVGPGVLGGIKESGSDFGATGIDSATGIGTDDGDIPEDETLESAAKTLSSIVGIFAERTDHRIDGGRVIEPAVAS